MKEALNAAVKPSRRRTGARRATRTLRMKRAALAEYRVAQKTRA